LRIFAVAVCSIVSGARSLGLENNQRRWSHISSGAHTMDSRPVRRWAHQCRVDGEQKLTQGTRYPQLRKAIESQPAKLRLLRTPPCMLTDGRPKRIHYPGRQRSGAVKLKCPLYRSLILAYSHSWIKSGTEFQLPENVSVIVALTSAWAPVTGVALGESHKLVLRGRRAKAQATSALGNSVESAYDNCQ